MSEWQECSVSDKREFKSVYDAVLDFLGRGRKVRVKIRDAGLSPLEAKRMLFRLWCEELSKQGDMTPGEYRAQFELLHAVPIAREDSGWAKIYDATLGAASHAAILAALSKGFGFSVIDKFNDTQMGKFMKAVLASMGDYQSTITVSGDLWDIAWLS